MSREAHSAKNAEVRGRAEAVVAELARAQARFLLRLSSKRRRELKPDPEAEAYWNDPANRHWARYSSVYDDRDESCG